MKASLSEQQGAIRIFIWFLSLSLLVVVILFCMRHTAVLQFANEKWEDRLLMTLPTFPVIYVVVAAFRMRRGNERSIADKQTSD